MLLPQGVLGASFVQTLGGESGLALRDALRGHVQTRLVGEELFEFSTRLVVEWDEGWRGF